MYNLAALMLAIAFYVAAAPAPATADGLLDSKTLKTRAATPQIITVLPTLGPDGKQTTHTTPVPTAPTLVTVAASAHTTHAIPSVATSKPTTLATSTRSYAAYTGPIHPSDTGAPSWVLGNDPGYLQDDCEMEMHISKVDYSSEVIDNVAEDKRPELRICVDDPESYSPNDTPGTSVNHQKCRKTKTVAISPAKPGCKAYVKKVTVDEDIAKDQDLLNGWRQPLRESFWEHENGQ